MSSTALEFLLIEPWFTTFGHIQFNRAFMSVLRNAFPGARMRIACSDQYFRDLWGNQLEMAHDIERIEATAWQHSGHTPGEFWRRLRWLFKILGQQRVKESPPTHLVMLGASGPTLLATYVAALRLRSASRSFVILHGGSDLLSDRRPRNPLMRLFTYRTALELMPLTRTKLITCESYVLAAMRSHFPSLSRSMICIPMAIDDTERTPHEDDRGESLALRILYLGQATPHKGFQEFIRLANLAKKSHVAGIEFRAAGALRRDVADLDQSALARRAAAQPLSRDDLLSELRSADFVFTWQSDYYAIASSGVLLDCVNWEVPLMGRRSPAISALEDEHGACGLFADNAESMLIDLLRLRDLDVRRRECSVWKGNLRRARMARSPQSVGVIAAREMSH